MLKEQREYKSIPFFFNIRKKLCKFIGKLKNILQELFLFLEYIRDKISKNSI